MLSIAAAALTFPCSIKTTMVAALSCNMHVESRFLLPASFDVDAWCVLLVLTANSIAVHRTSRSTMQLLSSEQTVFRSSTPPPPAHRDSGDTDVLYLFLAGEQYSELRELCQNDHAKGNRPGRIDAWLQS